MSTKTKSTITEVLTVNDIATECKVSVQVVISWINCGSLRAYDAASTADKKYAKWRVTREWLDRFILSRVNDVREGNEPTQIAVSEKKPHHI